MAILITALPTIAWLRPADSIWRGPLEGDGLEGEEWQIKAVLRSVCIDLLGLRYEPPPQEGDGIAEFLWMLKCNGAVALSAGHMYGALEHPYILERLFRERQVDGFACVATVWRTPQGRPAVSYLRRVLPREGDAQWHEILLEVEGDWRDRRIAYR